MIRIWKYVAILAAIAAAGVAVWWALSDDTDDVTLTPANIENIKSVVELSSMEIYEEVPVKGSVGPRHLVGRLAVEGSVNFDLEKLKVEERGDTIAVTLTPEIVTLRESTRPGSYTVIDTWNDNFLGSDNITVAEENRIKGLTMRSVKNRLYAKGIVKQARADAATSVKSLLAPMFPSKIVIVTDPTPSGTR